VILLLNSQMNVCLGNNTFYGDWKS